MERDWAAVGADQAESAWQVEYLSTPSVPAQVRQLRRRVVEFFTPSPFSSDELSGVEVAVGEACLNALQHGSPRGALDEVRVKCMWNDYALVVEVSDNGCGFDPGLVRPPALRDLKELREGGMGILLMRGLVDSVEFEFGIGTTVRLIKHRSFRLEDR